MRTSFGSNSAMQEKVSSFQRFGDAPVFVFCDHASNAIPADLDCLGLPGDILETHIAWDIGAAALAEALAKRHSGALFSCAFSRLIIDSNRALTAKDLIPASSDQIPVPGNQMLTEEQKRARIERFHVPYHDDLETGLETLLKKHADIFVISVHSFTNRLMGGAEERPWPVGLLWREDAYSARAMIKFLEGETGWPIGDNQPYDAREFNYSVDRHVSIRGLRHITVEVRQDMLSQKETLERIAELLAQGVRTITAKSV